MAYMIDLHTHSTASDGIYSPTELVQKAHEANIHALALTDHDTTNGLDEAAAEALRLGIEFVPGIEINTDVDGNEIHVLGYFLDYHQPEFQHVLQVLRNARERRGHRMVELLNEQGVHISWDHVRTLAQGSVGRPHVAKALLDAGYVQSIPEAFDKYIGHGRSAYVPRYKLAPVDAVRLIRSANGVPVMAHPLTSPAPPLSVVRSWLPELIQNGLLGFETYYGPYSDEEVETLRAIADEYHLVPTGGTDYHGPDIHPTPLGGRFVPHEAVARLKATALAHAVSNPPPFELPPPVQEK